jgi:hypothetical protein
MRQTVRLEDQPTLGQKLFYGGCYAILAACVVGGTINNFWFLIRPALSGG